MTPTTSPAATRRHRRLRRRLHDTPLAGVPPFDRYPRRELALLAAHVDQVRVAPGVVLAHEGWMVRQVFVVLSGEVHAWRRGRRLRHFGPGEQICAAELLCGAGHLATLVAGDDLDLLVVNGPAYRWAARNEHRRGA
jgi:CRP-like cAMP-binding protein